MRGGLSEFRASGVSQQSTGKEVAERVPGITFCIVFRKRGWWKRGYRLATVFGGQQKRALMRKLSMFLLFYKNLSDIFAVMTFLHSFRNLFFHVA